MLVALLSTPSKLLGKEIPPIFCNKLCSHDQCMCLMRHHTESPLLQQSAISMHTKPVSQPASQQKPSGRQ